MAVAVQDRLELEEPLSEQERASEVALKDRPSSHVAAQVEDDSSDEDPMMSFVVPHPGFRQGLKKNIPWKIIALIGFFAAVSMTLVTVLVHDTHDLQCLIGEEGEPDGDKTKMVIVANLLIAFIAFVLSGAPVEIVLLFLGAIAVMTGAIDASVLYAGLSGNAVVLLGLLFPIMKAMGDTGYPDRFIAWFMGNPKTLKPALFRMFIAVAILSGLFNNTPIVVMMIPVLMTYCQRLNFDYKAMLMPLSYASQAGGNLTLLGTSINLVAAGVFKGHYEIGFFTLTFGAVFVCIVDSLYCCFLAPVLLARKDFGQELASAEVDPEQPRQVKSMKQVQEDLGKRNIFNVAVVVPADSPLVGSAVRDCGLHRISGVHIMHRALRAGHGGGSLPLSGDSPNPVSTARLRESLGNLRAPAGVSAGHHIASQGWDSLQSFTLQAGDVLQIAATAEGVANLRQVVGITLANENTELAFLGGWRRQRCLCEAAVGDDIVGDTIDVKQWKSKYRCCVVGIRSMSQPTLCMVTYQDYELQRGDVLLLETFTNQVGSDVWLATFGIARLVPNSAPPRRGRRNDTIRGVVTCLGLLIMVILGTLGNPHLSLTINATMLAVFLLVIKGITVKEAYAEVNAPVLFTIVGALAMGKAMQATRLANCIAQVIVTATSPMGNKGVLAGMYIATVGLGQFLNSQGNVALMGTIAIPLAYQQNIPVGQLALTVVYAASACYMAPYGYQTNTLVMKPGGYSWGDYIKFGGCLQILHAILVVCMVGLCESVSR